MEGPLGLTVSFDKTWFLAGHVQHRAIERIALFPVGLPIYLIAKNVSDVGLYLGFMIHMDPAKQL